MEENNKNIEINDEVQEERIESASENTSPTSRPSFITILIYLAIVAIVCVLGLTLLNKTGLITHATMVPHSKDIEVVASFKDKITSNSAWCGTMEIVWQQMLDDLVGGDAEWKGMPKTAKNLNLRTFSKDNLSEDSYVLVAGTPTPALKEEITKKIEEKFNQKSDVLDKINWNGSNTGRIKDALFYTMLYKKFEFENHFKEMDEDKFKNSYEYDLFGVDFNGESGIQNQITVLYYNSKNDFAIKLDTLQNDNVIIVKSPQGRTFEEIYDNMNKKAQKFKGKTSFGDDDRFYTPNMDISLLKEYEELKTDGGIPSYYPDIDEVGIKEAVQTIKFKLDKEGGEIKSEAYISTWFSTSSVGEPVKHNYRYFEVNDTFAMFLIEDDAELPYFAARIDDLSLFQ